MAVRPVVVGYLILVTILQVTVSIQPGFSQQFDYTVSVSPTAGTVGPGGSVTATVSVTTVSGTPEDVFLLAQGLPSGVAARFQPPFARPPFSSTMDITVTTQANRPTGTFAINITAQSVTNVIRTTVFTLTVNQPPVLTALGNKQIEEEAALTFTATASDLDAPAQTLTFSLSQVATGTFPQGATITTAGVFTWVPTKAQGPGTYGMRIVVSDGITTDFEDITITVTERQTAAELLSANWPILTLIASLAALAMGYALGKPKPTAWYSGPPPPCGVSCNCTGAMCGHGAAGHCPPPGCAGHGHCARAMCLAKGCSGTCTLPAGHLGAHNCSHGHPR